VTIPIQINPKKSKINKSKYMRPQKVGYCVGKAFFRDQLVCRDAASIDNGVNILFDDFRKMGLIFGREGRFYAGHYESPENNIVEQYYIFSFRTKSRRTVSVMPLQGYWWAGRGNATLLEPTLSHRNALKTRRVPPVGCT
jgi:hypothetical protein